MSKGFSLVEVLIVIAVMIIAAALVVSGYRSSRLASASREASYMTADAFKEAVTRARAYEYDTDWGVRVSSTTATVFSGSSYAGRTVTRDHLYTFPYAIAQTGLSETVFSKFYGYPTVTGTTTFANGFGTTSVYVWSSGVIGY